MNLEHPESLVNFVAAFGQHPDDPRSGPDGSLGDSDDVTTVQAKRDAARALVEPDPDDVPPVDAADFMNSTGAWADNPNGVSTTGLDDVDLWVGGLAEAVASAGALLGSTFDYVFDQQLHALLDNDRLNYRNRAAILNLGADALARLVRPTRHAQHPCHHRQSRHVRRR